MIDPSFTGEDATLSVTDNVRYAHVPPTSPPRVFGSRSLFFLSFFLWWGGGLTAGIGAVQGRAGQLRWVHLRRSLQPQVGVFGGRGRSHVTPPGRATPAPAENFFLHLACECMNI